CLRIPKWHRATVGASRPVRRIPRAPLLTGHGPTVAGAHNVFHLALMANGEFDFSIDIPLAGTLNSAFVEVSVLIVVNVDELESAKVNTIGAGRPDRIEEIRIEDFERERHPAARRSAIQHTRVWFAKSMKILFDIRNQLASDGISVRSAVIRIHLIGITVRSVAVELKEDESRCVIGEPHLTEFRIGGHEAADGSVRWAIPTNVDAKRPSAISSTVVLRENHSGTKIDRPLMKSRQEIGLDSHILHVLVIGRQLLGRNGLR